MQQDKGMRPFRILGVQQIAVGGPSLEPLRHLWTTLLGVAPSGHFRSEIENVDEDICIVGKDHGAVEIDLMQPINPEKTPAVHTPPLNHVGLWVDDLSAAFSWLESQGLRFAPGGIRKGASGHDVCFIHPRPDADHPCSGEGVLIELVQAPSELIRAWATLE
jgi:lactoylglutathione lyase